MPDKNEEKKVETKADRIDRMERKIELIQDGLLILINAVGWANATITPIGTHDIQTGNNDFEYFETLEDAVKRGQG